MKPTTTRPEVVPRVKKMSDDRNIFVAAPCVEISAISHRPLLKVSLDCITETRVVSWVMLWNDDSTRGPSTSSAFPTSSCCFEWRVKPGYIHGMAPFTGKEDGKLSYLVRGCQYMPLAAPRSASASYMDVVLQRFHLARKKAKLHLRSTSSNHY
jgi:hypothetical protein